jgi:Uma2 family endonuclease
VPQTIRNSFTENGENPRWAFEVAQLYSPQGQWTEEEYFALPDTNRHIELSDRELIMPAHPTYTHQRVVGHIYRALHAHVTSRDLGIVLMAPMPVRLWPGKIREPDVFFIRHEHSDRIHEQYCDPPDLVVEVLSTGTWRVDRQEKLVEYARAGISEYWLVDPGAYTIEVFVLCEGAYALLGKWGSGEKARSEIIAEFEMDVKDAMKVR